MNRKIEISGSLVDATIDMGFKSKSEFNQIKNKRVCWTKCHCCVRPWSEIVTKEVHMINVFSQNSDVKNGTFFICDNCLES